MRTLEACINCDNAYQPEGKSGLACEKRLKMGLGEMWHCIAWKRYAGAGDGDVEKVKPRIELAEPTRSKWD